MSGWDAYVQTQLIDTGAVHQAAILGKDDLQLYAEIGGFQLCSYTTNVTNDQGVDAPTNIDEVADMTNFLANGTNPKTGWRMNQTKYQLIRKLDGPTVYLKCTGGGACVAATQTLLIIGVCKPEDSSKANALLIQCNTAVEALAEYLNQSGY
mmetsp:Transcript_11095/g.16543  ORF Transcript_11095/g.16543 Transcript_11095/m.16543 type:complete len:152 (+) Transcript_11095:129-584(+)|eukprot:CAMPEP_0171459262 /NCGR_PEP_ID=MMETSP0945-20130129/4614_1 /TAXON_ID=109269 /ORGANISM="Vaucheria litorea, Strain CCMP2940" /LENGTH=151 /DNA_ID=CAMNT_0011985241 /DNA_START=118 /DNA_END=573 /DNA_ORIENTATION=-